MIRGAIFDVDGTLLDSMHVWDTIGEAYLRSIGYEPREALNETFKTLSLPQAARYYQTEYGVSLSESEILRGVNAMLEHFYRQQVLAKPGIQAFLQQLQDHQVKMCVATALDGDLADAALKRCGIRGYFGDLLSCTALKCGKDEPDIYRRAAASLGTSVYETLVFEDACYALQTASRAGFPTVAVYDRSESRQTELRAMADFVLEDYRAFPSFWNAVSGPGGV